MMKYSLLKKWFAPLAFVVVTAALTGCVDLVGTSADACKQMKYGGKEMETYVDAAHKFAVCVPKGLTKNGPAGFADGRVVFSGFAVPAGTNLESKTLVIVAGAYPDVQSATPSGELTAAGVTFKRTEFGDGHAGHMDLHVTYSGFQIA